jgi:phospholipase C
MTSNGGCYDHVAPPLAVSPDARTEEFAFDRYGVRVPAVIISPYLAPGSIVRSAPNGLPHNGPPCPFDHTSILATLRKIFDLGPALTARGKVAPDLVGVLSLEEPENEGRRLLQPQNFKLRRTNWKRCRVHPLTACRKASAMRQRTFPLQRRWPQHTSRHWPLDRGLCAQTEATVRSNYSSWIR